MASTTPAGDVIAEQIAYHDAIAETYVKWANMSVADDDARASAALEAMVPAGHVLEIACGPGIWTESSLCVHGVTPPPTPFPRCSPAPPADRRAQRRVAPGGRVQLGARDALRRRDLGLLALPRPT
jgi:hypothetical protein